MKGKSKGKGKNLPSNQWELAVQDAKDQLSKNKRQAARLRNAIRIFEANAKNGEPWPGVSATHN